jgi:diguanylate cyclase (GGDEF)-like protein
VQVSTSLKGEPSIMLDPKRIWSSSQLPTLPTVAVRLLELSRNPETELREVVEAIKTDPALSAKIVKAANATYFGLKSEVKDIGRAVPLLGTTVSTSLALSFSLNDAAMTRGPLVEHYQAYWRQSLVQAAAAETLAVRTKPALAPEFFLSGLLQDLGRLAMLKAIPAEYREVLEAVAGAETPLVAAEAARLGFDHVEIGGKLMQHWKLPDGLVQAALLHHAPLISLLERRETAQFPLIAATAVAACVGDYFCSAGKGRALERLRELTGECYQFDAAQLDDYLNQCSARIAQAADLFNVDITDLGDPAELMVQANEQLVQLTLRQHVESTQADLRTQAAEEQTRALESRNRELQQQVLHDPLTKLYNRHFFDETLDREVSRAQRIASALGVLFLDLDHFKKLNDTYGHQFGDYVLEHVAGVFQSSIRSTDVLARYGGEEFVVLVSQPTEKGLEKLAERIRQRVEQEPFQCDGQPVRVTCSIGAAIVIPGRQGPDIGKTLIAAADACLYESKGAGRNRVSCTSLIPAADRELMQQVTARRFSRWLVERKLLDVPSVSRALLECPTSHARIGELAVERGDLTATDVETVLAEQCQSGERFGAIAVRLGLLDPQRLVSLLALQQENPKQLAGALMRLGLLSPDRVAMELEEYTHAQTPAAALA